MTVPSTSALDDVLDAAQVNGSIPSTSLHVRTSTTTLYHATRGLARRSPPRGAQRRQIYDLASLTKALVTAPLAAWLASTGRLDVHAPVSEVLPDVDPRITAWQLLCHTSGLPAWAPLYVEASRSSHPRQTVLRAARTATLQAEPGTQHTYSDLGFLVLLELIEACGGARLDSLFARHVRDPARVHGLTWGHPDAAATELCPERGSVVEGVVLDLNTASMGGISSHAGLFGDAASVARLATQLALGGSALRGIHETLKGWWAQPAPGSHRGGWDTPTRGAYTSTGAHFPDDAVGHLGYTGTSMWVLPSQDLVIVLLTNRIHPTDDLTAIRALRPNVHDAAWQIWAAVPED